MRKPKMILIATLVIITLATACHRKSGGGYLAPTPNNSTMSR